jgi:2-polyprenyl-6-hydroxyphenyl methylase / 3-demethylubiquinone-9 3-methyltransferase
MTSNEGQAGDATIDENAVAHFAALAADWWDPRGRMGVLHKFNPVRLAFIKETICGYFDRDSKKLDALAGLRILDIGCGAGILSEPLARLGAHVLGADPAAENIAVAKQHAVQSGLQIDYRATTVQALAQEAVRFDVVLAMEVVEHVADLNLFVECCAKALIPGGLMIVATINRTLQSFALAIIGAEYVMRWLPRGTHQWEKFVTPDELADALDQHGLAVIDETGVVYSVLADRWQISSNVDVNYMLAAQKPPGV